MMLAGCIPICPRGRIRDSELCGVWVGYEQVVPQVYRLTLSEDHSGLLGLRSLGTGRISLYKISNWSQKEGHVTCSARAIGAGSARVSVVAVYRGSGTIQIQLKQNGWTGHVVLKEEDALMRDIEMLKAAMTAAGRGASDVQSPHE